MSHLDSTEKARITDAIRNAEARTDGELVTVITHSSDDYLYIPTLFAALLALGVAGLLIVFHPSFSASEIYLTQVAVFFGAAVIFRWEPLKMALIPKNVKHLRASRKAHELFFIEGLHLTQDRYGVMLYVSVAERYVEIIADHGISEKVGQAVWDKAVDEFSKNVKQGEVCQGYLNAIAICGDALSTHCPSTDDERAMKNELPNHLIEI